MDTHRVTTELGHTTGKVGQQRCLHMEPQRWSHRILSQAGGGHWARLEFLLAGPPHGGVKSEGENEAGLDPSSKWSTLLPFHPAQPP